MTHTCWHVTPADKLPAILAEGLVPQIGPRAALLGEPVPAVYLFPDLEAVETALANWLGECFEDEAEDCRFVLLEVALPADVRTIPGAGYEVVVLDVIPPSAIRLAANDVDAFDFDTHRMPSP